MLSDEEPDLTLERLGVDELLAKRPVELVPLVGFGGAPGAELGIDGMGLRRKRVTWHDDPRGEMFGATWTATSRDHVPCTVSRLGVVLEPGGPVAYYLEVDPPREMAGVGSSLKVRYAHPVVAQLDAAVAAG